MTEPVEVRLDGASYDRAKQALANAVNQLTNVARSLATLDQEVCETNPDVVIVSRASMASLKSVREELEGTQVAFEDAATVVTL